MISARNYQLLTIPLGILCKESVFDNFQNLGKKTFFRISLGTSHNLFLVSRYQLPVIDQLENKIMFAKHRCRPIRKQVPFASASIPPLGHAIPDCKVGNC